MDRTTPDRSALLSAIDVALFVAFAWMAVTTLRRS